MARLKLRESFMPGMVSLVNEENSGSRPLARKDWKASPDLFPVEISEESQALIDSAVDFAVEKWGERGITALEGEDRLAIASEKAPTDDPVIQKLRTAFQVKLRVFIPLERLLQAIEREYKVFTEEEKVKVIELGGLHVIGTERHEARRIDNQLRGRGGRQVCCSALCSVFEFAERGIQGALGSS